MRLQLILCLFFYDGFYLLLQGVTARMPPPKRGMLADLRFLRLRNSGTLVFFESASLADENMLQ